MTGGRVIGGGTSENPVGTVADGFFAKAPTAVVAASANAPPGNHGSKRSLTAFAEGIRWAGSFAIMSAIMSTNSAVNRGFNRRGSSGRNLQCAWALSAVVPPGNGTLPVTE